MIKRILGSAKHHARGLGNKVVKLGSSTCGAARLSWKRKKLANQHYLFVMAHPRSGSTLLNHILCTNADIAGFGENQVQYRDKRDLFWLASRTAFRLRNYSLSAKYIMDKIVWPKHSASMDIKGMETTKFVFIIREPVSTLNSMAKLTSHWKDEQSRHDRYVSNLDWLLSEAQDVDAPSRCLFLRYEDLVNRSDEVFTALNEFLEIPTAFSKQYDLLPTTGKLRYGDPSTNIKSGAIQAAGDLDETTISKELLQSARAAHTTFLQNIPKYATLS